MKEVDVGVCTAFVDFKVACATSTENAEKVSRMPRSFSLLNAGLCHRKQEAQPYLNFSLLLFGTTHAATSSSGVLSLRSHIPHVFGGDAATCQTLDLFRH